MTKSFSVKEDLGLQNDLSENVINTEMSSIEAFLEKPVKLISLADDKVSEASLKDMQSSFCDLTLTSDIANRIEAELAKFWTGKSKIRSYVREVNKRNVFNFIKNMITVTNSSTVLDDIRKYITYYELKHIIYSLLKSAEAMGLSDNIRYRFLYREYEKISKISVSEPCRRIDRKTTDLLNLRLNNLFELMCRYV